MIFSGTSTSIGRLVICYSSIMSWIHTTYRFSDNVFYASFYLSVQFSSISKPFLYFSYKLRVTVLVIITFCWRLLLQSLLYFYQLRFCLIYSLPYVCYQYNPVYYLDVFCSYHLGSHNFCPWLICIWSVLFLFRHYFYRFYEILANPVLLH